MVNEEAIEQAVSDLKSQKPPQYAAIAEKYNIDRTTLMRRFKGETVSYSEARSRNNKLLTNTQELVLIEYIRKLSDRGLHPTPRILENLVLELVRKPVGGRWIERFQKRYKNELASVYLRNIDQSRHIADNSKHLEHYFALLQEKIKKYHIKPSNIYNFNEKGFLMGICRTMKHILPIDHLRSKKVLGSSQNGSQEFISLLATICADGSTLPPALIYQGNSYDLQDTWLEDYDCSSDEVYFAVSKKGWTNEELGLSWLSKLFESITRRKSGNTRHLLIIDGHSSHVNMRFIEFCDNYEIILAILPPHSTHRLQPLDVGIFSPLSTAYSNQIDHLIQSSQGFNRVSKRSFWSMFRTAWKTALSFENIRSAFAATAVFPLGPEKVLNQLKKTPSPISSDSESKRKTPGSVRGIRRAVKAIRSETTDMTVGLDLILRASEKLAVRNDILEHEIKGLHTALVDEKKRRKKGKPIGLFLKDEPGQAIFFSPAKIAAVQARQEELEAQKELEKLEKETERQKKVNERECKAQEAQERRETKQRIWTEKLEQKQREKEAHTMQKQLNQQPNLAEQLQKDQNKQSGTARKRKLQDMPSVEPLEPKTRVARSGRTVALPNRFME